MTSSGRWVVQESDARTSEIRSFFHGIGGVPTPDPGDFDTAYVVIDDGDIIGMAVVDTFTRPLLYGIGVQSEHRRQGVGAALLNHCVSEHARLYCRVRKDNEESIALCASIGMGQHESMWPTELWRYEAPTSESEEEMNRI